MKKETWKLIIQIAINVLTAIATAIGVTSCFAASLHCVVVVVVLL